MRRAAPIVLLILASCTPDAQTTEPPAPAPTLTTIESIAPQTTETTLPPATIATTTSTTTTTTTTLSPSAAAAFGISQVVFGDSSFVIITNWGDAPGSLDGFWLSQSDIYQALPDVSLGSGEQALIGLAAAPPPELTGMAATLDLGPAIGFVAPGSGEVALHRNVSFDEASSLVAYVEWGESPHRRSQLAAAAGIWDGTPVAVFDDAPSISTGVYPAVTSLDWSLDIGG